MAVIIKFPTPPIDRSAVASMLPGRSHSLGEQIVRSNTVLRFPAPAREEAEPPAMSTPFAEAAPPIPARKERTAGQIEDQRKALLAKIHVAKAQLGLTDAEYRSLLDGHFGAASAADLDLVELKRMVLVMQEYGFVPARGRARRGSSRKREIPATLAPGADDILGREPLMRKIEALLAEKGRCEGTEVPWAYAVGILKRQSGGVTRCFEHATPEQLRGVIAALTGDAKRKGRYAGSRGD